MNNSLLSIALREVEQWENHDRFRDIEANKSLYNNGIEPDSVAIARELVRLLNSTSITTALAKQVDSLLADNTRLRERVEQLERMCTIDGIEDLIQLNDSLHGLLASHEQQLESEQISKGNLVRDNARLREQLTELGIAMREVSSAVGAGMGDGETVAHPPSLAKAILNEIDVHIRVARESGAREAIQRIDGDNARLRELLRRVRSMAQCFSNGYEICRAIDEGLNQ